MKLSTISIIVLVVIMLISNLCWANVVLDSITTDKYQQITIHNCKHALDDLIGLTTQLGKERPKQDLILLAEDVFGEESFEKEGITVVGWFGFEFEQNGTVRSIHKSF